VANPQVILSLSAEDNLTATLKHAQDELKNFAAANKQLESQLRKYGAANDRVNTTVNQGTNSLRSYRSGMAQLGYQIQDIAVQIQGGQNLGIILGQQGSQIASVFGPGGIVAGAIIAVGALIGTALVPQLFKAEKSTEDLAEETLKYTDNLQFATEAQIAFVESFRADKLKEQEDRLADLNTQLARQNELQKIYRSYTEQAPSGFEEFDTAARSAERLKDITEDLITTQQERDNLLSEMGKSDAQAAQTMMETNFENEQRLEEDSWKAHQARIKKQQELDKKAQELRLEYLREERKAELDAVKAAEELRLKEQNHSLELLRQERQAEEEMLEQKAASMQREQNLMLKYRADELKAEEEYQAKVKELSDAAVGNMSSAAGALAANLKEGPRAQQVALAVQKGLAVGQAIMNMHGAISEANKLPFPANISLVARAAATGLGAIAGVQAVSFEGGGYTGMGIRAGGLDGRGGMPAIVHPNETIIDHSKGQGMGGVSVNFTIQANDTTGFDRLLQQRKGLIVSMINQAVNNRGRASLA
jgi:hypothetical protein